MARQAGENDVNTDAPRRSHHPRSLEDVNATKACDDTLVAELPTP
jgi:hypothetical protein